MRDSRRACTRGWFAGVSSTNTRCAFSAAPLIAMPWSERANTSSDLSSPSTRAWGMAKAFTEES